VLFQEMGKNKENQGETRSRNGLQKKKMNASTRKKTQKEKQGKANGIQITRNKQL